MADTLSASVSAQNQWSYSRSIEGFSTVTTGTNSTESSRDYLYGTTVGKINAIYAELLTLNPSDVYTLDLYNIVDPFSTLYDSYAFVSISEVTFELIPNAGGSGSATSIRIGGVTTNEWTGSWTSDSKITIYSNGSFQLGSNSAQVPVSVTNRNILITNNDSSYIANVRITIYGTR